MTKSKQKPSHLYSSLSMAIVMFLLGLFFLIVLHAHNLTNIIKEKMNVVVELEDGNKESVVGLIKSEESIRNESIQYISKEEALTKMNESFKFISSENENPFSEVVLFNIKSTHYSQDEIERLKRKLASAQGVLSVSMEDATLDQIKSNLNALAYVILTIGFIFVLLSIAIIRNTINLSMYADRHEIKTMELVGARWSFIKMPYIKSSISVGIKAFLIAAFLLLIIIAIVYFYAPIVWEVIRLMYVALALIGIFLIAILIPALSANSASNKYLNASFEGLYR